MLLVSDTAHFRRVRDLPRRVWTPERAAEVAAKLTDYFRAPGGTWDLRPIQAIALVEAAENHGGFFPIRVGGGKTLLSLLLPRMFRDKTRPLLLVPAALREKTHKEREELRHHFVLPPFMKLESYQTLSTKRMANFLDEYQPDLIIADECHYLKNTSAACTRRVRRYMKEHYDQCAAVFMSGTVTKRSIRDFAHLSEMALGEGSPAPYYDDFHVIDEWSRALDVNVSAERRMDPGVLRTFGEPARIGYRERLIQTPGVVATQDPPLPIDVTVTGHVVESPLQDEWTRLRDEWQTPDGWDCQDPIEVWRHARELSLGCYYRWDPRPPAEWMGARSTYAATVREILSSNRRQLDTELQVREAIEDGHYPWAEDALEAWQRIEPTFTPNVEHVWLSDHVTEWVEQWAAQAPGIVWVDHVALGARLRLPYYANLGTADDGRYIEDHDPAEGSLCASIAANATGRNLQAWNRMLFVSAPSSGDRWEQALGRMIRPGQKSPCVTVDVLVACAEDIKGWAKVLADTAYTEEITGQAQILTHADIEGMEVKTKRGRQWN